MKIEYIDNPKQNDIEIISESLFQYNCREVGVNDYKQIAFFLKNEKEIIVGGIIGWTRWGMAHIDNLWIEEMHRGKGYGLQLLKCAEAVALERGCTFVDLDTFDFQAPIFYLKHGYREMFVLDGFGNGNKKYFMKKNLQSAQTH